MKKYVTLLLLLLLFPFSLVKATNLDLYSSHVILYNLDEHKILYEEDADEQISIASMTKIMTAIVALENIEDLDAKIVLKKADFAGLEEANASVAGFKIGQKVTYRDLLYGLLLPSGADAALALTRTVANGRESFIALMNEKAKALGLKKTHFVNETGLDDEEHYSTVKEVATIFEYALKNKDFKEIIETSVYKVSDGSLTFRSTISKNLTRFGLKMDYLLGGKTGSTYDAGLCLASIAFENGVNYMLITAGASYGNSPYHLLDAKTIYEYFIENYETTNVIEKDDVLLKLKTKYAKENEIVITAKKNVSKYVSNDFDKKDLVFDYNGISEVNYATKKGTKLGTLNIYYKDELLYEKDIILEQKLKLHLGKYMMGHKIQTVLMIIFCFIIVKICVKCMKKKKKRKKR